MTIATLNAASLTPDQAELVPQYYDTDLIVTPEDDPFHSLAMRADLEASFREHGRQLIPGWVCPSPELPENKRLLIEGKHRLAMCRTLGWPFWAFDAGRFVPEEERIRLIFSNNYIRRRMSREEIRERAARYIEITGKTQAEAAKRLGISESTLSKAFGDERILPELRDRADLLAPTVRSLVASMPPELMPRAVEFALTPREDGKHQTRDQVVAFIRRLKKGTPKASKPKASEPKTIPLRMNGRTVTITVGDKDSAFSVAEDLKAITTKLARKDIADVAPEGWPFLFP